MWLVAIVLKRRDFQVKVNSTPIIVTAMESKNV